MKIKKIEDYQLEELKNQKVFINKYDLSLKYSYELNAHLKELFFDILQSLGKNDYAFNLDYLERKSLFSYMMDNYKDIIETYHLDIDTKDYIEITDYISYKEWSDNLHNGIAYFKDGIYLISKN